MKLIGTVFLLVTLSINATGCSGRKTKDGQVIDSASIDTKVKTKLLTDQKVNGLDINVDTYEDTVQLSGFVDSREQKERAGLLASQISGVGHVVNDIEVRGE